ncbi:MAG: hypothetical protein KGN34_12450 [Sphingomonadales bacterium]|nr:hypothetical protein [Sphingomonadales bacterium]
MKVATAIGTLALAAVLASPANAGMLSGANLLKVAQVVLRGRAVLNQGQAQCGATAVVKPQENLLMTAATVAVQKALPAPKFDALSLLANRQAASAATRPAFCANVAQNRSGVVGQIAGAAQQLGVGGLGGGALGGVDGSGLLGSALGSGLLGGAPAAPAAPSTTDAIGALLGIR